MVWLKQFLLPGYWFWFTPGPLSRPMLTTLLSAFGAAVVVGIILRVLASKKKGNIYWSKGVPKIANLSIWSGIIGLVLVWVRQERIYLFSARFWLALLGIVFLVWLSAIIRYMLKVLPIKAAEFAEKARIEKYLPKNK